MKLLTLASNLALIYGASYDPTIDEVAKVHVQVDFVEWSYAVQSVARSTYTHSTYFTETMNSVSVAAEGSGTNGVAEGSGSLAVSTTNQASQYAEDESQFDTSETTEYQEGKNQVLKIVTKTVEVLGESWTYTDQLWVDSASSDTSYAALRQMATDYLNVEIAIPNNVVPISPTQAILYTTVKVCGEGDFPYKHKCYNQARGVVEGRNLNNYDGAFYPTPEPYLKITNHIWNSVIYDDAYSPYRKPYGSKHPTLYFSVNNSNYPFNMKVEMIDHDDSGSHDLMCHCNFNFSDLIRDFVLGGEDYVTVNMPCTGNGSSSLTLYPL